MNEKIKKMINEYSNVGDFYGPIEEKRIREVEDELNVKFPKQYKDYLSTYGSGGICGIDIEGIEGDLGSSLVQATIKYRKLGLNENAIVIYDLGEFIMCLESNFEDSKVFSWEPGEKKMNERYSSFDDFIEDYFQEGIDNY
ncbi:SUKH superfamily protein [Breznakia blatticola]|uniref:SUKH superfamily protein n=1 Tax=Breznakia blatticola TaxID=1754012 RepID=A0A4R7ZC87_9FIRM|nr:SMI1/KNR4 family protein [Breznakia blatticola]TDW09196.1 SUKH superfamily protein [Breznakia blatticola]